MIKETTKTTQWVRALKSGDYEQATEYLNTGEGMCCLGVLADINNIPYTYLEDELVYGIQNEIGAYNVALLPTSIAREYGLDKIVTNSETEFLRDEGYIDPSFEIGEQVSRMTTLSHINDLGNDFDTIAGIIEKLDW